MAFPGETALRDAEAVEPHEERSAAEALYARRLAAKRALYERPRLRPAVQEAEGERPAPERFSPSTTRISPEGSLDEVSGRAGEDRVSDLYRNLRESARAKLARAAQSKAQTAAVKWGIRLILPYLLPILAVIGVILAIVGLAVLLTTLLPAPGASPFALPPVT